MKTIRNILTIIFLSLLVFSCEKDEPNPFIGSWENTEVTVNGSVVATITFRADMTQTVVFVVDTDGVLNTISNDYSYSYTDTELTVSQPGGRTDTTEYTIAGNILTLPASGPDSRTYTKVE